MNHTPHLSCSSLNSSTLLAFISAPLACSLLTLIPDALLSPRMSQYLKCVQMFFPLCREPPSHKLVLWSHLDLSVSSPLLISTTHKYYFACILKFHHIMLIPKEGPTRIQRIVIFCILESLMTTSSDWHLGEIQFVRCIDKPKSLFSLSLPGILGKNHLTLLPDWI